MKINWRNFNIFLWIFVLAANLFFNIWFITAGSENTSSWSLGMAFVVFVRFFAPAGIIISSIIIALLKKKYVKSNHKGLSVLFLVLLYGFSCIYIIYLR